jgi:hypothetical protein
MTRLDAVDAQMSAISHAIREVNAIEAMRADDGDVVRLCTDARGALYNLGHRLGRDFVFEMTAQWWSEI